jgi:hypothetical protein
MLKYAHGQEQQPPELPIINHTGLTFNETDYIIGIIGEQEEQTTEVIIRKKLTE